MARPVPVHRQRGLDGTSARSRLSSRRSSRQARSSSRATERSSPASCPCGISRLSPRMGHADHPVRRGAGGVPGWRAVRRECALPPSASATLCNGRERRPSRGRSGGNVPWAVSRDHSRCRRSPGGRGRDARIMTWRVLARSHRSLPVADKGPADCGPSHLSSGVGRGPAGAVACCPLRSGRSHGCSPVAR